MILLLCYVHILLQNQLAIGICTLPINLHIKCSSVFIFCHEVLYPCEYFYVSILAWLGMFSNRLADILSHQALNQFPLCSSPLSLEHWRPKCWSSLSNPSPQSLLSTWLVLPASSEARQLQKHFFALVRWNVGVVFEVALQCRLLIVSTVLKAWSSNLVSCIRCCRVWNHLM